MNLGDKIYALLIIIVIGIFAYEIKATSDDLDKADAICNSQVVRRTSRGFKLIDGKLYAICGGSDKTENKNPILVELK